MAPGTTAQAFSMLMDCHAHAWNKLTLGPQLAMTVLSVFGLSPDKMNSDCQMQIADSR